MTDIPKSTRALQFESPGKPVWKEIPLPRVEDDQVLLKVRGITTCPHWDLHMMDGIPMFPGSTLEYPLPPGLPGHEAMGEVVAVGKNVRGIEPGASVAAWRDPGNRRMGCYARYVPIRAEDLIPIDPGLLPEQIASLELAMCVQGSFDQMSGRNAVKGKRIAIGGLGPSGLVAVQLARAHGAQSIVGLDPLPARRALAISCGADAVWDPQEYAWPRDRFAPSAFDSALDTTGLPVSIEALMTSTRETVAIFGVLREQVRFGPDQWWGDFALLGYATHNRAAAETAYRFILEGKLSLAPLVSATLPFERYAEGIEMLRRQYAMKILFDPWDECRNS
jgi:threonine dehydrogenase-like Zn-dependent dehydrogenase